MNGFFDGLQSWTLWTEATRAGSKFRPRASTAIRKLDFVYPSSKHLHRIVNEHDPLTPGSEIARLRSSLLL